MFFVRHGHRVVAHDRPGHRRSTQTADGHDNHTYAVDAAVVAEHLDLRAAVHIGHSTGGGEVTNAAAMPATQRPIVDSALAEASGEPAWKTIPSWFLFGSEDHNIPPAAHRFMAHRAGSR